MSSPATLSILQLPDAFLFQFQPPGEQQRTIRLTAVQPRPATGQSSFPQQIEETVRLLHRLIVGRQTGATPRPSSGVDPLLSLGRLMYNQLTPVPIQKALHDLPPGSPLLLSTNYPEFPWELLHDGDSYLVLKHPLARQWLAPEFPPVGVGHANGLWRSLLIGNPTQDLAQANQEIEAVVELIGSTPGAAVPRILMQARATKSAVLEQLVSGAYDLIHYSGHVISNLAHPALSGLLLANGEILTAREIQQNLSGQPLVFLNGCESGRGALSNPDEGGLHYLGQATQGLAGAIIQGGAQGFIGTFWPVQDSTSQAFALAFYRLALQGETIGRALQQARRNQAQPFDPLWASYLFYGDPNGQLTRLERRELRSVTVLAARLSGLRDLFTTGGLDQAAAVEYELRDQLAALALRYGGTLIEMDADSFTMRVGIPQTFEDNGERALRTAFDAREIVCTFHERQPRRLSHPLGIRIGICTGPVLCRRVRTAQGLDYQSVGPVQPQAAMLAAQAAPEEIWLDEATYRQVQSAFVCKALGELTLANGQQVGNGYQALAKGAADGPAAPAGGLLIGRAMELRQLHSWWQQAATGQGRLVGLSGAAGVGKTRLVQAFKQSLADQPHQWLAAACHSYNQERPYTLIAQLIAELAAIAPADDEPTQRTKLETLVAQTMAALNQEPGEEHQREILALLGRTISLDFAVPAINNLEPELWQKRLIRALQVILALHATRCPLIIALEDLQWVDEASLTVLKAIAAVIDQLHLLLLVIYRPDQAEDWLQQEAYCPLRLAELDEEARAAFLTKLLAPAPAPPTVVQAILQQTGGNPLFIAEMVKSLQESSGLVCVDDTWRLTLTLEQAPLSTRLEHVIQARLDRLPDAQRETLEKAAVIGQKFDDQVLEQIQNAPARQKLAQNLTELANRGLIRTTVGFTASHTFTHALIHQTIYSKIWEQARRALHRLVAQVIRRLYGERESSTLAYHYYHSNDRVNAIRYALHVANQAAATWANQAALLWYARALEKLQSFDREPLTTVEQAQGVSVPTLLRWRMEALLGRAEVLSATGANAEAITNYQQALALATMAEVLSPAELADFYRKLAIAHHNRGEIEVAWALLNRGLALLGNHVAPEAGRLHLWRGLLQFRRGQLAEGLATCQNGIAILAQTQSTRDLAQAYNLQGLIYRNLGDSQQALHAHNQSITLYRAANDLAGLERAYSNLGCVYQDLGQWDDALHYFQESATLSERTGEEWRRAAAAINLGEIYRRQGKLAQAIQSYTQARQIAETFGFAEAAGLTWMNLGVCYLNQGDTAAAAEALQKSLDIYKDIGVEVYLPEVLRYQAELSIQRGEWNSGLELAQQALAWATQLGRKLEAGQAQRVVGQALYHLGRLTDASAHLQESLASLQAQHSPYEIGLTLLALGQLFATQTATQPENFDKAQALRCGREAITLFSHLGAAFDLEAAQAFCLRLEQRKEGDYKCNDKSSA